MSASVAAVTTLTCNPALDEAVAIDGLILGATNRCSLDALDPGGKGINASRVISRLGRPTRALGFIGGPTGALLRARLDAEAVPHAFDDVDGDTRINIMIYEREPERRTRVYLPGPHVDPARLDGIYAKLDPVGPDEIVVVAGSLPPGLPDTTYRDVVACLRRRSVRTVLDTSGAALAHALDARPFLIKPNVEEAEDVLGRALGDDASIVLAARELRERGATYVVISQGARGAIGVGPEGAWNAIPPAVNALSTVGSGDSMVAGLAIAFNEGAGFVEALRLGTATGAATATAPGTRLCERVTVERLLGDVVISAIVAPPLPIAGRPG